MADSLPRLNAVIFCRYFSNLNVVALLSAIGLLLTIRPAAGAQQHLQANPLDKVSLI